MCCEEAECLLNVYTDSQECYNDQDCKIRCCPIESCNHFVMLPPSGRRSFGNFPTASSSASLTFEDYPIAHIFHFRLSTKRKSNHEARSFCFYSCKPSGCFLRLRGEGKLSLRSCPRGVVMLLISLANDLSSAVLLFYVYPCQTGLSVTPPTCSRHRQWIWSCAQAAMCCSSL